MITYYCVKFVTVYRIFWCSPRFSLKRRLPANQRYDGQPLYRKMLWKNVSLSALSHHNESHKAKPCNNTAHCSHDIVHFFCCKLFHRNYLLGTVINYSVLSAITGSFFAATLDGNKPAISVKQMLIAMSITAALTGIVALIGTSVRCEIIMFIGMVSR